ncbi:MAG: twin-arginine translocation signal domain-containing protein [Paracoccus sp. (in: a-proteobacteria)]
MNRRDLLKAVPAAGVAAAIPSLGLADAESPLRVLYRQWQAAKNELNADCPDRGEAREDMLRRQLRDAEQQAADFAPRTMEDLAFKIIFADDNGDMDRTPH